MGVCNMLRNARCSATLKIKKVNLPESVELGSTNEIIMDCDFEANNETDLEVKWFYNGEIEQIYQWIPGNHQGFGMNRLKNRLDLKYSVSNDTNTKYRALRITNITQDLSGNYTCKVSSFDSEDSRTKQLIIYSPAKTPLEVILFEKEAFVICTTSGIYPEPQVDFYIQKQNGTQEDINEDIDTDIDGEGYYNVTAKHRFDNYTLNGPTKFVCNVSIAGTDYYLSRTLEYLNHSNKKVEEEFLVTANATNASSVEDIIYINSINLTENTAVVHTSSAFFSLSLAVLLLVIFSK
ncbi:uncharacterized protein isoform X2 [Leptinotarsa decemlineata]|uniref:uncharacterized protein isoform X2 n=1 Tax=Leptinotarsa decemlineata TaxID=7539 RepID=UPI003D306151